MFVARHLVYQDSFLPMLTGTFCSPSPRATAVNWQWQHPLHCGARLQEEVCDLGCRSTPKHPTRDWGPALAEGWHGSHTEVGCGRHFVRPGRSSVCGLDFRLGALVRLAGRRLPAGLPAGLLVSPGHRTPAAACGGVEHQQPGAPSAPDQTARDLALDALPLRHGHCPDHGLHCH